MAAPPPDTLIAALLAAVLGVFAPATGFVVTVLKPGSTTTCSPAGWEARAQQLADQLADSGSVDAQSLRQQLASAGVTPSARNLAAPTTSAVPGADWQELAAKLSGELATSDDPEAQKLAQAIGDTGTPDTTAAPTTRTRSTAAPSTSAPGAARPMPGDTADPSTAPRSPGRSATPSSTAQPRPDTGPCPAPSSHGASATGTPSAAGPSTQGRSSGALVTPRPTSRPGAPGQDGGDRRWEQLAGQLAVALAGSTDPRAVDLQQALDRAGFPAARPSTTSSRATATAPRTTAAPEPDDPGGGG